uniref:Small ribosomal subunit protein uS4c n=1 Tax=Brassica oleracea var. oleracea TaxID=109376 RepID=A0A0D3D528_BRAOL
MRLDNILFQLGMALTIPQARQLVNHGYILVNGRIVDIRSYRCKPRGIITVKDEQNSITLVKNLFTKEIRDEESSRLCSDLDVTQARLESVEGLLNILAVGNPQMQRMLQVKQHELGIPDPPTHSTEEEVELERIADWHRMESYGSHGFWIIRTMCVLQKPLGFTRCYGRITLCSFMYKRYEDSIDPLRVGLLRPIGYDHRPDGLVMFLLQRLMLYGVYKITSKA